MEKRETKDQTADLTMTKSALASGRTTTSLLPRVGLKNLAHVIGLRVVPNGGMIVLSRYRAANCPKQLLSVGAGSECDIRFDKPTISRLHCMLELRGKRVLIRDCNSRNGTWVNATKITEAELLAGSVVQLGSVRMVAFGSSAQERNGPPAVIPATDLQEFLRGAVDTHGSLRSAAEATGIPYSTLRGWLQRRLDPR